MHLLMIIVHESIKKKFEITDNRNKYLHRITANKDGIAVAITTFNYTLEIILYVTGLGIGRPGKGY